MSRSGYHDDVDHNWYLICYRGAVASAIRGKRGQAFLKEMLAALDALPVKRLIQNDLVATDMVSFSHWGLVEVESVCAIGAVGRARGIDMAGLDPDEPEGVAAKFDIAEALAREIVWENDEAGGYWNKETPEARYRRVRSWVESKIKA